MDKDLLNSKDGKDGEGKVKKNKEGLCAAYISKMSNEDQVLIKQCMKLSALWKVVRKRVCDYVPMHVRHEMVKQLISKPCEDTVFDTMEEIEDLQRLMSVDENMQRRMERNKILLANMLKAKEKLADIDIF